MQFLIFSVEAIIAALMVLVLFRLRHHFGLAPLYVTLGVFQPIQVLLASSIYVEIIPSVIVSPGSVVMFTASLVVILLVYISEDANETRKVIYGIMIANLTMTFILLVFGLQLKLPGTYNYLNLPKEIFYQNARVMVSGTVVLFADVILLIFVYEGTWKVLRKFKVRLYLRIYITLAIILIFDSLAFYTSAFYGSPNYSSILVSGIVGKLSMAILYTAALTIYLVFFETEQYSSQPFKDFFYALTYRQRYEMERSKGLQWEQIFRSSGWGISLVDADALTIKFCNEAFAKMHGYNQDEILGVPIATLQTHETRENRFKTIKHVQERGSYTTESNRLRKDGTTFPAVISIDSVKDDNGKVIYWAGNIQDITEVKKTEAILMRAQRMESIGILAGGIAHDFNNILTPIIGYSELLQMDLGKGNPLFTNTEEILKAAFRGKDLVQQILEISRQDPEKSKIKIPVKIPQILREAIKLIKSTIPPNIEIFDEVQEDCHPVLSDPVKIHQIVMNILINAYQALEETGGRIDIVLKEIILGEGDSDILKIGSYAALSITDTGQGINKNLLNKIFEPYFTTKNKGRGTGLGLSIVYGIVKENNGNIKVYSEEGKGTTFNIFLPSIQHKEVLVPKISEVYETGSERVLIIDDEEPIVSVVGKTLENLGYKTTSCTNGQEALEKFENGVDTFDLVITDMSMPYITGDMVSKKMLSVRPDLPIILMTGFGTKITEERCKAIGIKALLNKPLTTAGLAKVVRKVLDESDRRTNGLTETNYL